MVQNPAELLLKVKRERDKRNAERSLYEFVKQAWPVIEPGTPFVEGWHIKVVCDHLEAVTDGRIKNLLINIPPGSMKSILVSVCWPAWEWINNPTLRYLGASYGADLAIRDAMKCRDIVTSEWYATNWPHVSIRAGDDQKTKYGLTGGGWRMATSVGGRATGEHPDVKICDDPHSAKMADSDAERLAALEWFDRTLSSRGVSRGAKTVIVMQRLHESDLSGHVMRKGNFAKEWSHLCLPMEFDEQRSKTALNFVDHRKVGELLWPNLYTKAMVDKMKIDLGSYGTAGQLQQRPAPAEGGIVKRDWFKKWPRGVKLPKFEFVLQSYDTAFTKDTTNDPTGCITFGIFSHEGMMNAMILDCWTKHMEYPELRKEAQEEYKSRYGDNEQRVDLVLIEEKGSGITLIQDLQRTGINIRPYNPGRADKWQRLHSISHLLEQGLLWIPESNASPGDFMKWAWPYVDQMISFPNAEHDEYVDCTSQAFAYFRDSQWLELAPLLTDDDIGYNDDEPSKLVVGNPYAL